MVPGKNGGTNIIYYKVLRPFFLKHQDQIDKSIGNAKETFGKGLIFSLFNCIQNEFSLKFLTFLSDSRKLGRKERIRQ